MKLSWVHSTAIGGVTPALAAPMHLALRVKIFPPFLVVSTPNGLYMIDKFRWDVYSGLASKEDMNCHWLVLVPIIITVLPPQVEAASLHPGHAAPHHPHQGPVRCRGQVSRGRRHRLRPLLHRLNLQVPVLPLDVS